MEGNVYQAPKSDLSQVNPNRQESVTTLMVTHLEKAAKWAKVLAIMGYTTIFFLTLGCLGLIFVAFSGGQMQLLGAVIVYMLMGLIIFKLSRFLQQYARSNYALSESYADDDLIEAQEYFRRYTKWLGVIFLVVVGLTVGVFVLGITGVLR